MKSIYVLIHRSHGYGDETHLYAVCETRAEAEGALSVMRSAHRQRADGTFYPVERDVEIEEWQSGRIDFRCAPQDVIHFLEQEQRMQTHNDT